MRIAGVTCNASSKESVERQVNNAVPDSIIVHIINRSGKPFLGSGETGQGPPAASIANAIADATGKRLRDLPLTRKKIKNAIDA